MSELYKQNAKESIIELVDGLNPEEAIKALKILISEAENCIESAEKWILEANKISQVKVTLDGKNSRAEVYSDKIIVRNGSEIFYLYTSDLSKLTEALSRINDFS